MNVFVTGGTGYVGRIVVDRLLQEGHKVRILQRANSPRRIVSNLIEVVEGDLFDTPALRLGLDGQDAVIHLVGIIREHRRRGITMQRIHEMGTRRVIEAAHASGIHRILHMSALNAREHTNSAYHRSKWAAERAVRESGLDWTIFQPSVIFGRGGPGPEFVGQLTTLVRHAPVVPVIGHGDFPLQPVSIQTVAEAFTRALQMDDTIAKVYELGGPEVLTYRDVLQRIADALNKPLRTLRIPVSLMSVMVPICQHLPGFPITTDQLKMLLEGNVCSDTDTAIQELHLTPIPFEIHPPE